jgi:glutamate dehydrogenase
LVDLPLPKPYREIFVYAPRIEGIHLRGGKVARGGLRWSDRRDDFRTEVLGLVKAQMVKNAVIVPVGSKGGFYPEATCRRARRPRRLHAGRGHPPAYKTFLRACSTSPTTWRRRKPGAAAAGGDRHDGDDPYLVVAADKGTATFSDIANGVSADYGFWLGDAFASGGSAGYDHKAMGITARGAWEAVKRHFRETGQGHPVRTLHRGRRRRHVGRRVRQRHAAVAAHRSWWPPSTTATSSSTRRRTAAVLRRERERLFKLPRSSWDDYDKS